MHRRLLILGAGAGASNNLIRSLRTGDPSLFVVGCHHDRFVLRNSPAERNYLVPADLAARVGALARLVDRERIDLVIPNSDAEVRAVGARRIELDGRLFLPAQHVIDRCQDKYELTTFLRARGIAAPRTYPVTELAGIDRLFAELGSPSRVWCRIRTGASSSGALPVRTPAQARSWIEYWEDMRGVPAASFTLSEYLPGRDFSLQGLWHDGALVLVKMAERLSYFVLGNNPSGVSSTPAVARTLFDPRLVSVCSDAIAALDPRMSGICCFDLREDASGVPNITEINAGRFAMITPIYDLAGTHNMAVTYVRLALGDPIAIAEARDHADEHYLVRDLDTLPGVYDDADLFENIHELSP